MQKTGFRLKLIAALIAVTLIFAGCGLALALTGRNAGKVSDSSANGGEVTSASTFTTPTFTLYAYQSDGADLHPEGYKGGQSWHLTRNGNVYTEQYGNMYVTINCSQNVTYKSGTITLYSPVYGFYAPTTLTKCYAGSTTINFNTGLGDAGYEPYDLICKYDYISVNVIATVGGVDYPVTGNYYMNDRCDITATHGTYFEFTSTTENFTEHFVHYCWDFRYWDYVNYGGNGLILGRPTVMDVYGTSSQRGGCIKDSFIQYTKDQDTAGTLPVLYFCTGAGAFHAGRVTNTPRRYNGLDYACTAKVSSSTGYLEYYFSNEAYAPFYKFYLIEIPQGSTLGGITFSHTIPWYNPAEYPAGGGAGQGGTIWNLHEGYKDNPSVSYAASGTNVRVDVNGKTKSVSGIVVNCRQNANFVLPTAEMFDYVKISDYKGYTPTPIIPTEYSISGSVYSFVFSAGQEGYSIVSVEGAAFIIIWVRIDADGTVTDILDLIATHGTGFTDENNMENFTVLIKKGFTRLLMSFTKTFTFVGNSSNVFTQTTNAESWFIIDNSLNRCYEYSGDIWGKNLQYDDDANCYILNVAYSAPDFDYTTSLFGISYFSATEGTTEGASGHDLARNKVSYLSLDSRTRYCSFNEETEEYEWGNAYILNNVSTINQWIYYYNGDTWKDTTAYATVYLSAVGAEPYIIRVYCTTPAVDDMTATVGGTVDGTVVTLTEATTTLTFSSIEPMTKSAQTGDFGFTITSVWNNKKYDHTVTITRGTVGNYTFTLSEAKSGASYVYSVHSKHTASYALNLSSTMNMMFATETVNGNYTVTYARVVGWQGENYNLGAGSTVGDKTVWTFNKVSPHNASIPAHFELCLHYDDGGEGYDEVLIKDVSIVGYCYTVLDNDAYAGEDELLTLVVDTLHYCSRAYEYVYGLPCAWDDTDTIEAFANIGEGNIGDYTNAYGDGSGVTDRYRKDDGVSMGDIGTDDDYIRMAYVSAQVVVEGNPYINFTIAANTNFVGKVTYTATVGGEDIDIVFVNTGKTYKQDYIYLYTAEIAIAPTQFDAEIVITCTYTGTAGPKTGTSSESSMTLTYSMNSFPKNLRSGAPEEACARAMYSYGESAKQYDAYINGWSDFT